ncbi:MAG: peptide ABC transporter substrate-binding protein [Proteobacteria bacterium]|nr:peptide ABC transporter substrate-binding protein [Pseudomonadota bacterium]
MTVSLSIRILIGASLVMLASCHDQDGEFARPREKRDQPVELVLLDDGRPHPAVLAEDQTVIRGNGEEPQTLDPHQAESVPSANILRDLFEGLTTEAPAGDIIPGAAIRWNISRDARTYTFYLRRDMLWSNGDPLTADDFVFSLRRAASPATASPSATMLLPIQNAREVLANELPVEDLGIALLDKYTLQITLTGPTPYFLGLLTHPVAYPVNRRNLEEFGDEFSRPDKLVSNGAYVLRDWKHRVSIELEKNPLYREAENTIVDHVIFMPIEDVSVEVTQFRSGALDWTNEVPNNQFAWLQRNYPDELVISPWMGSYFFGFNLEVEPFVQNPELRQALSFAIDRQIITDKVTQFGEQPSFALVPPGIEDYIPFVPEYADWTQEQRNEEARRLYELVGYSHENPLRTEIRYNSSENHKKIALAIASMWKQVLGVNTSLVNEEFRVFLQNRQQKVITQVFRAGWISDYNDPYSFLELFRTGDGRNDYGYSNSIFDAVLDEVATERIRARRSRLMFEAERILLSDFAVIPIYSYVTKRLVDQHLKGWQNNVMDHHLTRYMYKLKSREAEETVTIETVVKEEEQ